MKKLLFINFAIMFALILGSCGSSNDVVSNRLISKRKYTKGFHVNKRSKQKSEGADKEESVLASKETKKIKEERKNTVKQINSSEEVAAVTEYTEESVNYESSEESSEFSGVNDSPIDTEENTFDTDYNSSTSSEIVESRSEESSTAASRPDTSDPVMLVLLIILAIIIPPLAILIYSGATNWFWIDLVLFLLAIGAFFWNPTAGLLGLAAVVIAFLVIFDVI